MKPLFATGLSAALVALTSHAIALDPIYVCDIDGDRIWRLEDLGGDGDFNDAGEAVLFYADTWAGVFPLSANSGVRMAPNGSVFVSDTTEDYVLQLVDLNGDGNTDDAGEVTIWFDGRAGGNASGVLMNSGFSFCIDAQGLLWVASASTATGVDAILRLEDVNGDGDANDLGEALEYYLPPVSASLPQATGIGLDGRVYYTENGTAPGFPKGIYRLEDLDLSGTIDQPGEATAFFIPPAQTNTGFHWNVRLAPDGWLYFSDSGNEFVWKARDLDLDGDAQDAGESQIAWSWPAPSLLWDLAFASDGSLLACESQAPDRVLWMVDASANGTFEVGETSEAYSDVVSATDIGDPRGLDLAVRTSAGTAFCAGDGTGGAPCPCGNSGASGHGCDNSAATGGSLLEAFGTTSPDTVRLYVAGELPSALSIVLQGNVTLGTPVPFGDGLRCIGGSLKRLYVKSAVGGGLSAPKPGDPSITAQSATLGDPIAPGTTRGYQVYYRDPDLSFCTFPTGNTWNVSGAVLVSW